MSEISLILVLLLKTNKTLNDMAKVQIKSEKLTLLEEYFRLWSNLMLFWHSPTTSYKVADLRD